MQILTQAEQASQQTRRTTARKVLVPTMGALHRGHLELIRTARASAGDGKVIVSIFVNPLQFAPGGDYEKYPRPESSDEQICRDTGVDLLFRPTPAEMYASDPSVFVEETLLSQTLCGKSRAGHFRGVCTVVSKLFHILHPDAAIFGEKDFQQLAIIRRMVRDLNFPIEIIGVPTVREADGLACSSRNEYLTEGERKQAPILRAALLRAVESFRAGEKAASAIASSVSEWIKSSPLAKIDYVEIVDPDNLNPIATINENALLAVAVFFGRTRLIDNIRLR